MTKRAKTHQTKPYFYAFDTGKYLTFVNVSLAVVAVLVLMGMIIYAITVQDTVMWHALALILFLFGTLPYVALTNVILFFVIGRLNIQVNQHGVYSSPLLTVLLSLSYLCLCLGLYLAYPKNITATSISRFSMQFINVHGGYLATLAVSALIYAISTLIYFILLNHHQPKHR